MKKFKIFIMAIAFLLTTTMLPVQAAESSSTNVADDSIVFYLGEDGIQVVGDSTTTGEEITYLEDSASTYFKIPAKPGTMQTNSLYLMSGRTTISVYSPGTMVIYGATTSTTKVSSIMTSISLEKLVNGSWTTIGSHDFSSSNASVATGEVLYSVQVGAYYRVSGSHAVSHNGLFESVSTCTEGLKAQ